MRARRFRDALFRTLSFCAEGRLKRVRYVSRAFEGIERIDCFEARSFRTHPLAYCRFIISFRATEKFFMWLYTGWLFRLYLKTLGPIRKYFREKRWRSAERTGENPQ